MAIAEKWREDIGPVGPGGVVVSAKVVEELLCDIEALEDCVAHWRKSWETAANSFMGVQAKLDKVRLAVLEG